MSTTSHPAANPNSLSPENNAGANSPEDAVPEVEAGHADADSSMPDDTPDLPWLLPSTLHYYIDDNARPGCNQDDRTKAWAKLADAVKSYSEENVKRWNSEIDTLLVYAGLFSAILTAFNVQSYSMLTPQSPDPVLDALERISAQLGSFTVNERFVNSTLPATTRASVPSPSPSVPNWAVWLNALWFSSLIFSLSAASVGILVKQWLNEYSSGLSGNSRQTARLRQHRLNNLLKWRVEAIVAFLPVLLQVASVLFFAGLLVLLWHLNRTVASIASIFVGILLLFTIATTVLPSIVFGCSYVSPASRAVFEIIRIGTRPIAAASRRLHKYFERLSMQLYNTRPKLALICRRLARVVKTSVEGLAWSARERKLLEDTQRKLDVATIVTAYTTTMDVSYLNAATPCILELGADAIQCFLQIEKENVHHRGGAGNHDERHWTYQTSAAFATAMLLISRLFLNSSLIGFVKPYLKGSRPSLDPSSANLALMTLAVALGETKHPAWPSEEEYQSDILLKARFQLWLMQKRKLPLNIMTRRFLALAASRLISHHHSKPNPSITEVYVRALDLLLMTCIPTQAKEEADPEEMKTVDIIRAYTRHAFMDFGNALFLRQWTAYAGYRYAVDELLDRLRIHGSGCGVLSWELVKGLSRLLDAGEHGPQSPFDIHLFYREWIRELEREWHIRQPPQEVQRNETQSDTAPPAQSGHVILNCSLADAEDRLSRASSHARASHGSIPPSHDSAQDVHSHLVATPPVFSNAQDIPSALAWSNTKLDQDNRVAVSLTGSIQAGSEDANAPLDGCETPVLVFRATSAAVEGGSSDSAVADPSRATEPSLNSDANASSVAGQPVDYGGSASELKAVDGRALGAKEMPPSPVETTQLASGSSQPSSTSPEHTNVDESLHHVPTHIPEVVKEAPPTSSDTAYPYVSLPLGGTPVRASSESASTRSPQAISQTPHVPSNAREHPGLALSSAELTSPETLSSGTPHIGADGSNESDANRPSGGGLHRTLEGVAHDAGNLPVLEVTADAGSSPTPPQGTDTAGSHIAESSETRDPAAVSETAGVSEREAESASASESDGGLLAAVLARDPATRSVDRDGVAPSAPPGAYVDADAGGSSSVVADPCDHAETSD